ncbi:hypothetical protein [Streptomyces sp. NPDC003077]|uniref:hypothetical protein n=1 Tax=Streptomyces sp. NPDC003077 TaxID=3154443 RepID=UPI0033A2B390
MLTADAYEYVVDDSAVDNDCAIWFALPAGFFEIPLQAPADDPEAEGASKDAIRAFLELVPQEQRMAVLADLEDAWTTSQLLRQSSIAHFAMGVHQADDGSVMRCVFTIAWQGIPWTPAKLSAAKAAMSLPNTQRAELVELPCGPAAITQSRTQWEEQDVFQTTGYLPHPDGKRIAVLTLSTTATAGHEQYRDILLGITHMVSFDNPLPEHMRESIPEPEGVASARAIFG